MHRELSPSLRGRLESPRLRIGVRFFPSRAAANAVDAGGIGEDRQQSEGEKAPPSRPGGLLRRALRAKPGQKRRSGFITHGDKAAGFALCLFLACSSGTALASDGFQEGSFGDAAPAPAAQGTVPESDDGFGGSFGEDTVAIAPEPGQAITPPAQSDDGFIDEGNIETPRDVGQPAQPEHTSPPESEIVIRPPHAQPPVESPPPPETTAQPEETGPAQGPGIDPGILAFETRDFGVPPTDRLRSSNFHAPTPTSIPGGQLVTTGQLAAALQNGQKLIIIDVLGAEYTLPNALSAPAMANPGNYRDRIQQQTNQWLGQITGNNPQIPIILACSDPFCWLSYNASLRAIAAGYKNVYWYRGGHQAWNMAGLPFSSSGF